MSKGDIFGLVISSFFSLIMIALSVVLLLGKGANLIAGYNTSSKEEKAKYDEKALSKFVGKILLPIGLALPLVTLGGIYDLIWPIFAFIFLDIGLIVFALIYINSGNRFRKK